MLRKLRKSSSRVTLVLIGVAALGGCGGEDDTRQDVYKSREDCLADWGNRPEDCRPATQRQHSASGFWYGPAYGWRSGGSGAGWTREAQSSRSVGTARSSSSSGISRGGFGASGRGSGG